MSASSHSNVILGLDPRICCRCSALVVSELSTWLEPRVKPEDDVERVDRPEVTKGLQLRLVAHVQPISLLVGEMPGRAEGGEPHLGRSNTRTEALLQ